MSFFKNIDSNYTFIKNNTTFVFKYALAFTGSLVNWILTFGRWNDSAKWVDTERWKDG